jgi:SAM-dependent methyltransferase
MAEAIPSPDRSRRSIAAFDGRRPRYPGPSGTVRGVSSYALLVRPAANRVFGAEAARLLGAELGLVDRWALGDVVHDISVETIAAIEYVTFTSAADPPELLPTIAVLSSALALFVREAEGLLRPVPLPRIERFDDDLVTTQRYVGKTNEAFTKLLLNLGVAASGRLSSLLAGDRVRVLDPLCGRGTTLNQALLYGCDAFGIDADAKATAAYATFLTTWLQEKRLKHQADPSAGRRRFRLTIGRKGAADAGGRIVVDVVTGDTGDAAASFGRGSTDVVVADLPYGVQHGSRTAAGVSRRPLDLVEHALPAWRTALRPGGAVALAWNTRVLSRDDLTGALASAGFDVLETGGFAHRVDRTITRDLVVARR